MSDVVRLGTALLSVGQTRRTLEVAEQHYDLLDDDGRTILNSLRWIAAFNENDAVRARDIINANVQNPEAAQNSPFLAMAEQLAQGDSGSVRSIIATLINQEFPPTAGAAIMPFANLAGDPQLALDFLLSTSSAANSLGAISIWQPLASDMRQLPAFKEAMLEAGLVDYWRSVNDWGDFCRPIEGNDDFECF